MECNFALALDFKSHRIRSFFLEKHKEFASLVAKFYKISVDINTSCLNLDGYSVDFCIIKNAIRKISEKVEGKIIVNSYFNQVSVNQDTGIVSVLCGINENFSINPGYLLIVNGQDTEKEFSKHLSSSILTELKTFNDIESVSSVSITVSNLQDHNRSSFICGPTGQVTLI